MKQHYDNRAKTLRESHPLGIQVNLETGVANGVLVVRSLSDCATLIQRIVTRNLDLELEETEAYTLLREKISGCVFRVMTTDAMLTNTFWNFYLDPAE
jgi:spore coat polysaccharide biosynthesis protein SpsF (cytidylyltransferase family)